MPKQVLQVTDFSAGLNAYSDAKDIEDNQFAQNWNAIVDKAGVIRVAGMAQDYITTEYHSSENFQKGYGLFQISVDKPFSYIDGNFSTGIKSGTASQGSSGTTINLEAGYSATLDEFNDMTIFIYSGAGAGQTRTIDDTASGASAQIDIDTAWDTTTDNTSKYIIYRWKPDGANWKGDVSGTPTANEDFITDGTNIYETLSSEGNYEDNYHIYTKATGITDNQSSNLGYIEYVPNLTLIPGLEYNLTFDCAAKYKWYNVAADGATTYNDESTGANAGYGDQPPWVRLYSETVSDTSGCVHKLTYGGSDFTSTTTLSITSGLSVNWTANKHWTDVPQTSTSGYGQGLSLTINSAVSTSNLTIRISENKGFGYAVGDTITFAPPDGTGDNLTFTVSTNGINHTGLSLYANNTWISKTDQDGYILDAFRNCVDDGDFVVTSNWTKTSSDLNEGIQTHSTDSGYHGHTGTLTMRTFNSSLTPYIYSDEMELDDLTNYNLNFLYDGRSGVKYAIYDTTNSQFIANWTNLPPTRSIGSTYGATADTVFSNFQYPNSFPSIQGGDIVNNFNYITFKTPKNKSASSGTASGTNYDKIKVRIYFGLLATNDFVHIHGVTVRKAHNDLLSLSYENSSGNPFGESVINWTTYYMKFAVPEDYSKASDWKLQLHAGQYSFVDDNDLGNVNNQEVYFKNIRLSSSFLSSEDYGLSTGATDTLTLLANNSNNYTDISIYSALHGTWITDIIRWPNSEVRPVYTYVNGMLKISDANFATSNSNKLMYYDERIISGTNHSMGWITRDSSFSSPPSLDVSHLAAEGVSTTELNLIPYLNEYYKDKFWDSTDTIAYNNASDDDTNTSSHLAGGWPLDCFGTYNDTTGGDPFISGSGGNLKGKYTGLVIRHFGHRYQTTENDSGEPRVTGNPEHGPTWEKPSLLFSSGSSFDKSERYLWDTTSSWFRENIDDGSGDPGGTYQLKNIAYAGILSNRGWSLSPQSVGGLDSGRVYIDNNTGGSGNEGPRWPIQFVVQGDNEDIPQYAPNQITSDTLKSIHSLKLNFNWTHMATKMHSYSAMKLPVFIVKIGKLSSDIDASQATTKLENGEFLTFDSNSSIFQKTLCYYPDSTLGTYTFGHNGTGHHTDMSVSEIDANGNLNSISTDGADGTWGWFWKVDANMNCEVILPKSDAGIKKYDNILIEIQEYYQGQNVWNLNAGNHYITALYKTFSIGSGGGGIYGNHSNYHESLSSVTDMKDNHTAIDSKKSSLYSRFKINNIDLTFYTDGVDNPAFEYSSGQCQTQFVFDAPAESDASGWAARSFKVALTTVNKFGEESYLQESDYEIAGEGQDNIEAGHCPSVTVRLRNSVLNDRFITKTKIYMRDSESDIFYLQLYVDHLNLKLYSTTSNKSVDGAYDASNQLTSWYMQREHMKNFNEVISYESETMVSQKDASSQDSMTARYKTSVVANNRLYVGNIKQGGKVHGDRMLKSPIGKYNILPASNFIDVAINDGDEITALAYYKDKILQFKKRKVFVINTSGDYEFLEDTFSNVGVNQQCQVATTPHGIVWANRRGCHLYDGKSMTNLIDNIIPETSDYTTITYNYWLASDTTYDGIPIVGYIDNRDTIIVKWEADDFTGTSIPDGASYHFPTKSWSLLARTFSGDNAQSSTGAISNMITDKDGDLLFYRYKSSDTTATSLIKKWNNASYDNGEAKLFYFTTKDFTFGDVSVRKKLYKVYITYKVKTDGTDSGVAIKGSINSSNDFDTSSGNGIAFSDSKSKFQGTSTVCYGSSTLDETDGIWKTAEMIFSTPSEVNNIYSFQLQLSATAVPKDFEINDISIVYKTKSLK